MVNVITNSDVPLGKIAAGEKVFVTTGLLRLTVSISATVHVPDTQPGAPLLFVTLEGGEITAVLVTCVCAKTD